MLRKLGHRILLITLIFLLGVSLGALINGLTESTELAEVLGPNIVRDAIAHRQEQIAVSEAGWLVREIFLASAV